jgi:uncharacterized membrane protein YraQ (UPF0718 family)
MDLMIVILPAIAVVCYLVVVVRNPALAAGGLKAGGASLLRALPLVVAGFALAGLFQAVEVRELVTNWLGAQSGIRGILLGTLLGALTPGPVYFALPLAGGLLKGGAGAGVVVAYVTAWDACSLRRLMIDLSLLDLRVVAMKFSLSIVFSVVAGIVAAVAFSKTAFS